MPTFSELREELAAKQSQFTAIVDAHPDYNMSDEIVADLKTRKTELADLVQKVTVLQEIEETAKANRKVAEVPTMPGVEVTAPSAKLWRPRTVKSVEQILSESKDYARFVSDGGGKFSLDIPLLQQKAVVNLTMIDLAPELASGFIPYAHEQRTVGDLMLQGNTSNNTIQYYEQTTRTNAAAGVLEEGLKPESAWGMTLRTDPVEVIATWMPATRQALSDLPWLQSAISEDLRFMVVEEEEEQLLSGNGTPPNISGILDRSGIQTQAKGADPTPTAIYNAITKIRNTGFAEPTAVVMHPNDWAAVATLQTVDGIYIWGNPALPVNETIWGLPVRITTAMTENTALVGAFRPFAKRIRREDVTVTVSTEHADFFLYNKVAILAEERLALQVTRPAAFCTVTGI